MGVYTPLSEHLKSLPADSWSTSFAEIEKIIRRPLPSSAYDYRPWWGNQKKSNHSQSRAWREAGWETREVDLKRKTVRFERQRKAPPPAAASDPCDLPENLWDTARRLSGIQQKDELIKAALRALIQQEAVKGLIAMGGTMPEFEAAPRDRPFE